MSRVDRPGRPLGHCRESEEEEGNKSISAKHVLYLGKSVTFIPSQDSSTIFSDFTAIRIDSFCFIKFECFCSLALPQEDDTINHCTLTLRPCRLAHPSASTHKRRRHHYDNDAQPAVSSKTPNRRSTTTPRSTTSASNTLARRGSKKRAMRKELQE
jgi:hypothetical protein